jgi:CRP-like cAMP-binding protein
MLTQSSETPHTLSSLTRVASQLTHIGGKKPQIIEPGQSTPDRSTPRRVLRVDSLQVLKQLAIHNRILAALPPEEFDRIAPHLETVQLAKDEIIYLTGDPIEHIYLPESGLLSLLSTAETGPRPTIEVAMCGKEGLVGLPIILGNRSVPYEVTVRFAGEAFKIKAEIFKEEFDKNQAVHELVLGYLNVMITQIQQSSICNRFHSLEETLSRWLLTVHDQIKSDVFNLTQQVISDALGVPRTGVTVAAGALQRKGAIRYSRGKIVIEDRSQLESSSCECYRIIRNELHHFVNE